MNCGRLFLVFGLILLLGLDTSNGQDEDNPDKSINNNPDDDDDDSSKYFKNYLIFWSNVN